jgi:hypothetical protein
MKDSACQCRTLQDAAGGSGHCNTVQEQQCRTLQGGSMKDSAFQCRRLQDDAGGSGQCSIVQEQKTVKDITGRFNEGQCRPVEDDAGESRRVRDIAGHLGLCRRVQDSGSTACTMVLNRAESCRTVQHKIASQVS